MKCSPVLAMAQTSANDADLPRVAVLLAAYNGAPFLDELLDSVTAQSSVSLKIFISIDPSTDDTEALLRGRAASDPRLVLLPTGQRFGSAAANFLRLLREADLESCDYVALADQDDIWLPHKLQRGCELLSHTGADAYSSNVIAFWPDGRRALVDKAQPQTDWDFLFEGGGPGCTFLLRRSLALKLKEFAESRQAELADIHHHDWLIYAYSRANGYQWIIDSRPGALYRQHGSNQVGVNRGWRAFGSRARAVLTGAGVAQALVLARVVGLAEHDFVRRMAGPGRMRFLRLAARAFDCRRRRRDQWLFGLACLSLFVFGERRDET